MRLSIESQQVALAPHRVGGIAERVQHLALPHETPFEARVTIVKHEFCLPHSCEVQVLLSLIGGPLYAAPWGTTWDMTVEGALQEIPGSWRNAIRACPSIPTAQRKSLC